MTEAFYELQASDVGRYRLECFGQVWSLANVLGRVLPLDVGKRVYCRSGVLQVENEEQRRFRLKRGRR
jgi:hypothetical protein